MADSNVLPVSDEEALKLCKPQDSETKDFIMKQSYRYRIKDPKISIPFYTEVLGMQLLTKLDFPTMKLSFYYMGYEDPNDNALQNELSSKERFAWAMRRKATIELNHDWEIENDDYYKYSNFHTDPKGFMCLIGLVVPDVYKACERFEKLGVNFIKKPEDGEMKGIALITDPNGH